VSQLEPGTVLLYLSHDLDRDGRLTVNSIDIVRQVSVSACVPVFGLYDTLMGSGILRGRLGQVELQGERAGTITARVLSGEHPADIPISGTEMNRVVLDGRQLRRWRMRERDLPKDSIVLYRELTAWERYSAHIFTGVTAIGLQSLPIGALLGQRRKWRGAERVLADQLEFETMLSDTSSRFVGITPNTISAEIQRALACIVEQRTLAHARAA